MATLYGIVLAAIFVVVVFFFYKEYTSSRSYRIKKSVKTYRKLKKEEAELISKIQNDGIEVINDEDRIMTIIRKINTGEEVKIPIAAFQYIYTRLNQICVVDKHGNVQIVNSEEFKKFQETAITLLDKDKILKDESAKLGNNVTSVFSSKKYPDGTIVKKNNVNGDITILKPDGTKYTNKNESNDLIIERPEKEEEDKRGGKNKKQNDNTDDINKMKNEKKNLQQEIAYMKNQMAEGDKSSNKKVNDMQEVEEENVTVENEIEKITVHENEKLSDDDLIENAENNLLKSILNENENSTKIDINTVRKNLNKAVGKKQTHVENSDAQKEENNFLPIAKSDSIVEENVSTKSNNESVDDPYGFNSTMEKYKAKVSNKSRSKTKNAENIEDKSLSTTDANTKYENTLAAIVAENKSMSMHEREEKFNRINKYKYTTPSELAKEISKGKDVLDFIFHLLNIVDKKYASYYVYDYKEKKIYISVDMFIFKLSCYLSEEDRELFLKDIKPSGNKTCSFVDDYMVEFVRNINRVLSMKLGLKPFYFNEEKNLFCLNKYTEFVHGEEKKFFKGTFLILNVKNSLEELLVEYKYLEKFEPNKSMLIEKTEGNTGLLHLDRILELRGNSKI